MTTFSKHDDEIASPPQQTTAWTRKSLRPLELLTIYTTNLSFLAALRQAFFQEAYVHMH